ncbi:MAG TPA: chemotaxis protein CheB [Acetobacteraceae bacterium]|nr:chemotaxis protein CheB [Acetobacteraceae bacterium]
MAIGASAGGLHAFTTFLNNLPPDTGMAFVLIQHLDPIHKSLLVALLAPHTAMPVVEAADGVPLGIEHGVHHTAGRDDDSQRRSTGHCQSRAGTREPVADRRFFTALAEDQKRHAVCVVLSGAGSDGARSLREVKLQRGLILAQRLDDGQMMTGMPHTAARTGLVDHVLPASEMPAALLDHQRLLREVASIPGNAVPDATGSAQLDPVLFAEICGLLRGRIGHDFSQCKTATLTRRIRRRMKAQGIATVPDLFTCCDASHARSTDCPTICWWLPRSFHYALSPGGWLFLGPSESTGHGAGLFESAGKRHRLFRRREANAARPESAPRTGQTRRAGLVPGDPVPAGLAQRENVARPAGGGDETLDRNARRALELYSPVYVVIDRASDIIRFSGGPVGRYLEPSPGLANLGLFGILRRPLRRAVRSAVHKVMIDHEAVV